MTVYPILPDWRRITRTIGYGDLSIASGAWDYWYGNTEILLNFEGLNNSTTYTNEAFYTRTIYGGYGGGDGQFISTADKKYGGSSFYSPFNTLPGTYLYFTSDVTGESTEAWVKLPVTGLKPYVNADNNILFSNYWNSGSTNLYLTLSSSGTFGNMLLANLVDYELSVNQWQHHSLQIGLLTYYHVDGLLVRLIQKVDVTDFDKIAVNFSGYIDSFRVSNTTRIISERFLPPGSSSPATGTSAAGFDTFYQANKLLCHFSQDFDDTSGWSNALTNNGASISTTEFKFSFGSLDATSGYVTVNSTDAISSRLFINNGFQYLSDHYRDDEFVKHFDYTIECWVKVNAANMKAAVFTAASNNDKDVVAFGIYTPTSTRTIIGTALCPQNINAAILSAIDIPSNTWTHIAWSRKDSVLKIFINGTQCYDSIVDHGSYYLTSIGGQRNYNNTATINLLGGYINDLRVATGVARYSGVGFTPPTAVYPDCPFGYDKPPFIANSWPPPQATLTGGGAGGDPLYSSVLLRCNFDGTNGSTSISDLSTYDRTITNNRGVISTASSKFGSSSVYYDGVNNGTVTTIVNNIFSGKSLSYDMPLPYGLGTEGLGEKVFWSIEWWMNIDASATSEMCIISNGAAYLSSGGGFAVYYLPDTSIIRLSVNGTSFPFAAFGIESTWVYCNLYSDIGTTLLRVRRENGDSVTSASVNQIPTDVTNNLTIGSDLAGNYTCKGYIDDLRVTYGKYRVNTTPSSVFPIY